MNHDTDDDTCNLPFCGSTLRRATRDQDRTKAGPCCDWFDCQVCGWTDPSGMTFESYRNTLNGSPR